MHADQEPDGQHRRRRLRPSGGYRTLRSFHVATIVYDATVSFCDRFVDKRSRTHDQMVQAARSGGKNIAEGSRAAAASSQTELRLVSIARASLEELLLDYEDYLRQHGKRMWEPDDPEALEVRKAGWRSERQGRTDSDRADRMDRSDRTVDAKVYDRWLKHDDAAIVANALLCLIHQANYLLDQQITALEQNFIQEGGYSEQLAAARVAERNRRDRVAPADAKQGALPACPVCGQQMVLRTARKGRLAGSQFWGCMAYPKCKGTRALDGSGRSD